MFTNIPLIPGFFIFITLRSIIEVFFLIYSIIILATGLFGWLALNPIAEASNKTHPLSMTSFLDNILKPSVGTNMVLT